MSYSKVVGGFVALIAIAILLFVFARGSTRQVGEISAAATPAGSAKGKPSPLIEGRTPAPAIAVATPEPESLDVPASMPDATPPAATATLPAGGVSFPADRKGFNNGCKGGTLTLGPAAVSFTCPSDPGKGFSASLAEIKDADDDGIQLVSGEKYHFKIEGHDKETMRSLFETWYARAHTP